jgi:hypothetical protein
MGSVWIAGSYQSDYARNYVLVVGIEQERDVPGSQAPRHLAAAWIGHEGQDAKFMWAYMFSQLADEYDRHYGLNDMPPFWAPGLIERGQDATRFYPEIPSRLGVIPRRGGPGDIRWFSFEPTYVLHWTNAYESGEEIVIEGFFQGCPAPASVGPDGPKDRMFRFPHLGRLGPARGRHRRGRRVSCDAHGRHEPRPVRVRRVPGQRRGPGPDRPRSATRADRQWHA